VDQNKWAPDSSFLFCWREVSIYWKIAIQGSHSIDTNHTMIDRKWFEVN